MSRWIRILTLAFVLLAGPWSTASLAGRPASPGQTSSWPQIGFDTMHTSFNQTETTLGTSNVSSLAMAWQTKLGGQSYVSPVVDAGMAFATSYDNGSVSAVDVATGTVLWRYGVGRSRNLHTPAVGGGRVFVSSYDTPFLYALDEATGALLWKIQISNVSDAAPAVVVDGDTTPVYVGGGYTVFAVDGATGRVLWRQSPYPNWGVTATPAVANGVVYVPDYHPIVHGYDATTGAEVWTSVQLGWPDASTTYVAIDGDTLIAGRIGGKLYALDVGTGDVLWSRQAYLDSQPSVANGLVYLQSRKDTVSSLIAVDEATGATVWVTSLGGSRVYSVPDAPSIANGVVYSTSLSGSVAAYDALTGAPLWRFSSPQGDVGTPAVVDGHVYVALTNQLYAFGLP
jgi:outer membrane protein assembly factor BamB